MRRVLVGQSDQDVLRLLMLYLGIHDNVRSIGLL